MRIAIPSTMHALPPITDFIARANRNGKSFVSRIIIQHDADLIMAHVAISDDGRLNVLVFFGVENGV
jgi:hypothetical protein